MKRFICLVFYVLIAASFLESAYVGKAYFSQQQGQEEKPVFRVPRSFAESWALRTGQETIGTFEDQLALLQAYFESEEKMGNLRLRLVQDDPKARMEHRRYRQYYKDLEVFGGEIIKHFKEGRLIGINGEYYEIDNLDTTPLIPRETAVGLFEADLERFDLIENADKTNLIIYPIKDGDYHVAFRIVLNGGPGYSMTGIIDAKTGEVLLKFSNIKKGDLTIAFGLGYHGEQYKFPTTLDNNTYWLMDLNIARPVKQFTYDFRTFDGRYWYVGQDGDNNWDTDGALICAHTFLGLIYDYYYLVHARKGIDNKNLAIKANVHWYDGKDNAWWSGEKKEMYFLDPGDEGMQFAGTLDIVAHEYSHGVTDYESELVYAFESGALNESFSDIMGTAIEFFWQEPGNGLLKADWIIGEDARPYYSTKGCRSLSNPNSNSQLNNPDFPDPCHLSQVYRWPYRVDNGGVHLNMTVYPHAYYLLANGGTNKVSGISVSGIGIEKATEIFYRAWIHYLTKNSDFLAAANALLKSAFDLYGSSSNEYAQTIKAMEAIGWIVK